MQHYQGRFMREDELRALGAVKVGVNVAVHETCVLVDIANIAFGSNIRIDPFAMLSAAGGWITIGDFVHIASHVFVTAGSGVEIRDFVGLSPGAKIFSRSDDFTGRYLSNPTVPAEFTKPPAETPVRIGRHVLVGAGSIVLPEVTIGDGSSVGAGSVVVRDVPPGEIHVGAPAQFFRNRRADIFDEEIRLKAALAAGEADLPVARL